MKIISGILFLIYFGQTLSMENDLGKKGQKRESITLSNIYNNIQDKRYINPDEESHELKLKIEQDSQLDKELKELKELENDEHNKKLMLNIYRLLMRKINILTRTRSKI